MGATTGTDSTNQKESKKEGFHPFANVKMPKVDTESMKNSFKKNLEIVGLMNKMSTEVITGITKVQTAFVKQMMVDMGSIMEKGAKPSQAIAKLKEVTRDTMVTAVQNNKRISDMISANNSELSTTIAHRIKESIDNTKSALKK